jgi:adenine-specific DNA-methyltransferase
MNFYETVLDVLKQDQRFFAEDGTFLRNAVYESAMQMDAELIKMLLGNEETKKRFFKEVEGVQVFDKVGFGWVINNRQFLPDNYTRYKNKIGLTDERSDFISGSNNVFIAFPYKDCLLEMDATADTDERKEVFYNERLMPDDIDRLLYPKVFTNCCKYSLQGKEKVDAISEQDNIIIKGNNLMALHSLVPRYENRIKLMYWDILYNSDNDKVPYNDSFKHSSWLVMMKNRLEVARKLLTQDGLIFIQCDDREMAYLKVLCDEIFSRNNGYVNTITVKTKLAGVSGSSEGKSLIDATEFILVYARNKAAISLKPAQGGTPLLEVIQEYKDSGKSWKYTTVLVNKGTRKLIKEDKQTGYKYYGYSGTQTMSVRQFAKANNISEEEVYSKYYSDIFRTTNAQSSVRATVERETGNWEYQFVGLEYVPKKGKNAGKQIEILYTGASRAMVTFLSDMVISGSDDAPLYRDRISTIWTDIDYNNLVKEGGVELPFGKKPEKLISRIIELVVDEGDIVLDAYLGTGTTAAVAHKRGIQYIGIEQLESHVEKTITRLNNVIKGDKSGISSETDWQGGGSFIYCELAKLNQNFVDEIEAAKDESALKEVCDRVINSGFISYKVDPAVIDEAAGDFDELSLDDKKRFLMEILDKNLLYVNYCDIDDEEFGISEEDKAFTRSFYREG